MPGKSISQFRRPVRVSCTLVPTMHRSSNCCFDLRSRFTDADSCESGKILSGLTHEYTNPTRSSSDVHSKVLEFSNSNSFSRSISGQKVQRDNIKGAVFTTKPSIDRLRRTPDYGLLLALALTILVLPLRHLYGIYKNYELALKRLSSHRSTPQTLFGSSWAPIFIHSSLVSPSA